MTRYQNAIEIDSGGQAKIYLADDVIESKKVIIKTVKHDNPGNRRRLQREARLLHEQRNNPFVVHLLADYSNVFPPCIVLEYCSGGSLTNWITNRRPVRDVVLAMQHIAIGVQGIHVDDGFHRDLTPRNLQVAYDPDGRWRIKIIDFGLGQTPNPQSGSMTRNFGGTAGYIAPEVEAGDDYTWRADIYSLGVVFRELLTGSRTKPLIDFWPPPAELTNLIDEMTAQDPLARPNTQYIFNELDAYLNQPAQQPKPVQIPQKQGSGWGWALLAALGTAAAIVANANDFDENVVRYRDSHGRFRSGMFS
jgi:serine/threonine protein kinase